MDSASPIATHRRCEVSFLQDTLPCRHFRFRGLGTGKVAERRGGHSRQIRQKYPSRGGPLLFPYLVPQCDKVEPERVFSRESVEPQIKAS